MASDHVSNTTEENVSSQLPADIELDGTGIDISFHPSKDVLAVGTIDGKVTLYEVKNDGSNHPELLSFNHHKKACRGLQFSKDGNHLFTISKDKSFQQIDLNSGSVSLKIPDAHKSPIYSFLVIDDYLAATGDDDGVFKLWDYRRAMAVMEVKQMEDYVSGMAINDAKKILLAISGEGSLTAFNVRAKRMELQSDLSDSEFLSVAIVKRESKVVVGAGDGSLNIFNWGEWGIISDRFPGHPNPVDCIAPVNDRIVCTGSSDGMIRAVNILPNRFIGVIGEHSDMPIEALSLSNDAETLASSSHDDRIKFWSIGFLHEETVSDKKKAKKPDKNRHLKSSRKSDDFFADLAT